MQDAKTRTTAEPRPLEFKESHGEYQYEQLKSAREGHRYVLQYGQRSFIDFADVDSLISDRRFVSGSEHWLNGRGISGGPIMDWWNGLMFTKNGESHRRLRKIVSGAFTPPVVEGCRTTTAAIAETLCDKLAAHDEIDLAPSFSSPLPLITMCTMLGIPEDDVEVLSGWAEELGNLFIFALHFTPETQRSMEDTLAGFEQYAEKLIADRRAQPRDDLVTKLIMAHDEEDRLTHNELVVMLGNLLVSANDSTRSAVGNTIYTLLRHPDQWRLLCENPSLAGQAVDEALRFESPLHVNPRVALQDLEFAGLHVKQGEILFGDLLGAGRDPIKYRDPDVFDITRTDVKVLCLGGGPHYCLGGPLARVMMQEALKVLTQRLPRMELVPERTRWSPISHSRHLAVLTVRPNG